MHRRSCNRTIGWYSTNSSRRSIARRMSSVVIMAVALAITGTLLRRPAGSGIDLSDSYRRANRDAGSLQDRRDADELRYRVCMQLRHHAGAQRFDRALAGTEVAGHLLVEPMRD